MGRSGEVVKPVLDLVAKPYDERGPYAFQQAAFNPLPPGPVPGSLPMSYAPMERGSGGSATNLVLRVPLSFPQTLQFLLAWCMTKRNRSKGRRPVNQKDVTLFVWMKIC